MTRKLILTALLVSGAFNLLAAPATPSSKKLARSLDASLEFCLRQSMRMYETAKAEEGVTPAKTTRDGNIQMTKPDGWISGFFPGTLWYLYENSGGQSVRKAAEEMTARILPQQFNTNTHDIGFIMNCSAGNGYRLTGRADYREALINAGRSLATRFSPTVGCTRSWKGKNFRVIVDNMMNLELLCVASEFSGDGSLLDIANTHAATTMKNHFRPDYSSFHVVEYDEATGAVVVRKTAQGLADDSSWARGQGWGLYGYTMMYRKTGKKEYLDQAVNIGKFIMNHPNLPKDKVPYWDFDAPASKDTPRDASAASLIASAMLELSQFTDGKTSKDFMKLAEKILLSLGSDAYRAKPGENHNFILMHATEHCRKDRYDHALAYADYYYVEALMRYKKLLGNNR